jgi:hypothetical protein
VLAVPSDFSASYVGAGEKARVEDRSSFLKKRSKKLLLAGIRGRCRVGRVWQGAKVFWFFFSKKNTFFF